MKHMLRTNLALLGWVGLLMIFQGCDRDYPDKGDPGHDHAAETSATTPEGTPANVPHVHPNPKYNEVLVVFPGHSYAMEIIDEKETTGLVTAFLTDAHFEPTAVDVQEVRLNFIVDGKPKAFTLPRAVQEPGKPATFTLIDMELATLICEGWPGEATAVVEIGGVPYNSKLIKLSGHDHAH